MPHPVVYPGNLDELIKKWVEQRAKDRLEEPDKVTYVANGECARLPQALTSVGHSSRWQPGERVIDVARTLRPGTVIANFLFEYDKMWYPNSHGYHAALFVRAEGYSVVTGKPSQIIMFDQYTGKGPSARPVRMYTDEQVKKKDIWPCNNASEFYVVMVP